MLVINDNYMMSDMHAKHYENMKNILVIYRLLIILILTLKGGKI